MSERDDRALSILQNLAADFIRLEANTNPLITVTKVNRSGDFRRATIFVTVYPGGEKNDATAIHFLTRKATEFREYLKENGSFKMIPHFDFAIDYGERNRQHIDEVAQRIEKEEKDS
jgi:ribosome-binding factor A